MTSRMFMPGCGPAARAAAVNARGATERAPAARVVLAAPSSSVRRVMSGGPAEAMIPSPVLALTPEARASRCARDMAPTLGGERLRRRGCLSTAVQGAGRRLDGFRLPGPELRRDVELHRV